MSIGAVIFVLLAMANMETQPATALPRIGVCHVQIRCDDSGVYVQGFCRIDPGGLSEVDLKFPKQARSISITTFPETAFGLDGTTAVFREIEGLFEVEFGYGVPWQEGVMVLPFEQSMVTGNLMMTIVSSHPSVRAAGLATMELENGQMVYVARSLPADFGVALVFDPLPTSVIDCWSRYVVLFSLIVVVFFVGVTVRLRK